MDAKMLGSLRIRKIFKTEKQIRIKTIAGKVKGRTFSVPKSKEA